MTREPTGKDLYVSEISFEVTEEDLRKLFTLCGKVRAIHMIKDQKGHFKGCAFVHMTSAAEGRDAITTLDGTRLVDRCIRVSAALPRKGEAPVATDVPQKLPKSSRPKRPRPKRRRR